MGSTQTTNFDALAVDTLYASGTGPGSFTLSVVAFDSTPQVRDQMLDGTLLWAISGTHSLGLNNSDRQFLGGDVLNIHFLAPVFGFGLYVITGGGNQPISNLQPYLAMTCVMALQGMFPSRN